MSPTDPIPSFNFPSTTSHPHNQNYTTIFTLQSLHFPTTEYQYPIIMVSSSPEPTKPTTPAETKSAPNSTLDSKKPDCWTDEHEAELKDLAAGGEEPASIIELMVTYFPCLSGKLSEEWIKEKIKAVEITG
jgi:hypothetical protein